MKAEIEKKSCGGKGCAEFYCNDCAGKPAKIDYPYKWCERCEGTGLMKVVHFDGDNKITGYHEMYCPDGCREPSTDKLRELLAAAKAVSDELDHVQSVALGTKYRLEKALELFML